MTLKCSTDSSRDRAALSSRMGEQLPHNSCMESDGRVNGRAMGWLWQLEASLLTCVSLCGLV